MSFSHYHRHCRRHGPLIPKCGQALSNMAARTSTTTVSSSTRQDSRPKPETITVATLIQELESSSVVVRAAAGASPVVVGKGGRATMPLQGPTRRAAKKWVPFLAVGSAVGAMAMGPVAGVVASVNLLVASVGLETIMAGIGLTASAAAAATVTHQKRLKAAQRQRERLRKGEWVMEICWNCKESFSSALSDEACRKDAELLGRFQIEHTQKDQEESQCSNTSKGVSKEAESVDKWRLMPRRTVPDDTEVYRFLFSIFASPSELLGQMNHQVCEAFRKRFTERHQKPRRRSSFTGNVNTATTDRARTLAKDTLQDTKMYIAHVLGATLQCFPSLASTSRSVSSCTLAVERIIYDDIHAIVFGEFQRVFEDAELAFSKNLEDIRREQMSHSSALLQQHSNERGGTIRPRHALLAEDLQKAEAKMVTMMQETSSPLLKLVLLCDAFRSICWFAEKLHKAASNADMLIPILCAFLVACRPVCHPESYFVAEIAFISFFTNGGGNGVEGYVLTTFQAAIQVIAAVDLPSGHALELELFVNEDDSEVTDDGDTFFDAVSSTPRESPLQH